MAAGVPQVLVQSACTNPHSLTSPHILQQLCEDLGSCRMGEGGHAAWLLLAAEEVADAMNAIDDSGAPTFLSLRRLK